jgi:hypothetical protein
VTDSGVRGSQRPLEQIRDSQNSGPFLEIEKVKALALSPDNAQNIAPLTVGGFATGPVPLELAEECVFRRLHENVPWSVVGQAVGNRADDLAKEPPTW